MRNLRFIFLSMTLVSASMLGAGVGFMSPAAAQTTVSIPAAVPVCGYWDANGNWVDNGTCGHNPYCGAMVDGVWVANGACPDIHGFIPQRAYVTGTITAVSGHLVTVQQSGGTLVINDQPALNRQTSGRVAVGRQITALGFWRAGTFYATAIL